MKIKLWWNLVVAVYLHPCDLSCYCVNHFPGVVVFVKRHRRGRGDTRVPVGASFAGNGAPTGPAADSGERRLRGTDQTLTGLPWNLRNSRELLASFVKRGLTESASEAGEEVLFAVAALGLRGGRRRHSELVRELRREAEIGVRKGCVRVSGEELRRKPEAGVAHG